jgi:hypothetical protein
VYIGAGDVERVAKFFRSALVYATCPSTARAYQPAPLWAPLLRLCQGRLHDVHEWDGKLFPKLVDKKVRRVARYGQQVRAPIGEREEINLSSAHYLSWMSER